MRNFPIIQLIILGTCLLISCDSDKDYIDHFTEASFNARFDIRDGNPVESNDLFLGQPTLIRFHPDSFLVLEEYGTPRLINILDLRNGQVQELISRGRGPGEMLVSWGVEIIDKSVCLFCGQLRKVIILVPNKNRSFVIDEEFFIEEKQTQRLHPLSRDQYVCLSAIGDDKRFALLDPKGKIIKKFGEYPPFINDDEVKADNDIFFSSIGSMPSGKRFVAICSHTDLFEIYDVEEGLLKRFQGPLDIKLSVTNQTMGIGLMHKLQPHYTTYHHAIANEIEFWTGFIGYRFERGKEQSLADQCTKKIYCFDWEGKPIRILSLPYPTISFDVDWEGRVLYALELHGSNQSISTYSLESILNKAK